jgi:hypothetical protein
MEAIVPKVALPQEPKPMEPKPNGTPAENGNPHEVYHLWDQRDEIQVVDTLKGRYLDEFVYSYCRRHKWLEGKRPPECQCTDIIVGLSWVGVQEAAREYRGIQVPLEKMRKVETEDSVEVSLEAIDSKTGSSRIGVACQSKKMRLRTGQIMDDEFATAKAVSKAMRNAIRPLLPITLIRAWIEAHRTNGNKPALPPAITQQPVITAEMVKPTGNGSQPAIPAMPFPTPPPNGGSTGKSEPRGYPSVGQVKRIFGIGFGHKVPKEEILDLVERVCGVQDPAMIPSRELYEKLCSSLESYQNGVPF